MGCIMYSESEKQFIIPDHTNADDADKNMHRFEYGELFCNFLNLSLGKFSTEREEILANYESVVKDPGFDHGELSKLQNEVIVWITELTNKIDHPYTKLFAIPQGVNFETAMRYTDFEGIQKKYRISANACLTYDKNPKFRSLSTVERFRLFSRINLDMDFLPNIMIIPKFVGSESDEYNIEPPAETDFMEKFALVSKNRYSFNYGLDCIDLDSLSPKNDTPAANKKNTSALSLLECCNLIDVDSCLMYEFIKLVQNDIHVQECKYCKSYFILKGNYRTDFCDNIPPGETKSCKNLGAGERMQKKIDDKPAYLVYRRLYKRYYCHVKAGKAHKSDFERWCTKAKNQCEQISPKEYNPVEFEKNLVGFWESELKGCETNVGNTD